MMQFLEGVQHSGQQRYSPVGLSVPPVGGRVPQGGLLGSVPRTRTLASCPPSSVAPASLNTALVGLR